MTRTEHQGPNATKTASRSLTRTVALWCILFLAIASSVFQILCSHLAIDVVPSSREQQLNLPRVLSVEHRRATKTATATRTTESVASIDPSPLSSSSVSVPLPLPLQLPTLAPMSKLKNSLELEKNDDNNKQDARKSVDEKSKDSFTTLVQTNTSTPSRGGTFALLFPIGLNGGLRNQVMRFIGFLRSADRDGRTRLLLPTVVWSTRYSTVDDQHEMGGINPVVAFWPVQFEELFDVDHWNTFHNPSRNSTRSPSLPKLVTSLEEEGNDDDDDDVCWKPSVDPTIVSVSALQKHREYKNTFSKSFLPLLTYRMLFGNDDDDDDDRNPRNNDSQTHSTNGTFVLRPLQGQVLEYLVGGRLARKRNKNKIDFRPLVRNCTRPYVYGGSNMVLWYEFLTMERRAPGVLPKGTKSDFREEVTRPESQGSRRLRKTTRRTTRKAVPKDDEAARYQTRFVNTVNDALVPAEPWRHLADHCVQHHLRRTEVESGYVALHARIEPEMLDHKCGKDMERNLTTVLDQVEALAKYYNEVVASSANDPATRSSSSSGGTAHGETPLSEELRERLAIEGRPLGGIFVAIGRDQMQEFEQWPKVEQTTRYNWGVLNARSSSYDNDGRKLFTSSLRESKNRQHEQNTTADSPLPIFECGEGWVEHAFYLDEERQRQLFTLPADDENRLRGLYRKYGPSRDGSRPNPLLPLPNNYFGDLLPSILNFWLAVNADVFVGAMKSSFSNDIWTMRYYQGKGDRNFQYTADKGIVAISNRGLPPSHENCDQYKTG
eukprot:jgi/Psemu1/11344/gm1.11344_g